MSTRPQLSPFPVITNGDMSLASLTSSVTIIQKISMLSYAYSWVGSTPVGTIIVQVSNDYSVNPMGNVNNAGTWNTIPFNNAGTPVTSFAVSGNTGNGYLEVLPSGAYAIRTVYTKGSGTGTLQCIVNGKVS